MRRGVVPTLLSDYHAAIPDLSVPWQAETAPAPALLAVNHGLAEAIGLDLSGLDDAALVQLFTGQGWDSQPMALAYSGHQFGHFSPVLGDGRALLLGESHAPDGTLHDVQLKGSGRTPFSRNGDGKAALGPVLREFLVAEAMHALGVPTTRALGAVATGERVQRETGLPGAILTRVAASHIRIGTFEYLASRRDTANLNRLIDYTLARHYPGVAIGDGRADMGIALLSAYADRLATLIAHWMSVGFVHGVMNTDNMALSGETIDYGPCAFIDHFNPAAVFSSIDKQGRYAFGNQPMIAQWNLARLAESILTAQVGEGEASAADIAPFAEVVSGFMDRFDAAFMARMAGKLGLTAPHSDLTRALWAAMAGQNVDFTGFFRALSDEVRGVAGSGAAHFTDAQIFESWATPWRAALASEGRDPAVVADGMDAVNPLYIPRNHKVEEALAAAHEGELGPWRTMLSMVTQPFTRQDRMDAFARPAPDNFGPYRTFCGT